MSAKRDNKMRLLDAIETLHEIVSIHENLVIQTKQQKQAQAYLREFMYNDNEGMELIEKENI